MEAPVSNCWSCSSNRSPRWDAVERLARNTPLAHHVRNARKWIESDADYGIVWVPLAAAQIPLSRFTPDQVDTLVEYGKLRPHRGAIRSFAKGWALPQPAKKRLRPIFEPFVNNTLVIAIYCGNLYV